MPDSSGLTRKYALILLLTNPLILDAMLFLEVIGVPGHKTLDTAVDVASLTLALVVTIVTAGALLTLTDQQNLTQSDEDKNDD